MARIIGVGCQGSSARGKVGSTVMRDDRRLPVGVTAGQSLNPFPRDPRTRDGLAARCRLTLMTDWWTGRLTVDGPNTLDQDEWTAAAADFPRLSGFNLFQMRALDGWRRNAWISRDPADGPPTEPFNLEITDVTAVLDELTHTVYGTCQAGNTLDPFHVVFTGARTGTPDGGTNNCRLQYALAVTGLCAADTPPDPTPFAFRIPDDEWIPGESFYVLAAAIGPGFRPGVDTWTAEIAIPS